MSEKTKMRRKILNPLFILLWILLLSGSSYAQNLLFPAGTNFCDNTPWHLVFYDEFNGTHLNTNKWLTFSPHYGTNSDYDPNTNTPDVGARNGDGRKSIWLDNNVNVNNGMCTLLLHPQYYNWAGYITNYTSGAIETKYDPAPGNPENLQAAFTYGRFEARIRSTSAKYSHMTMWLWDYSSQGEIDIMEAYGNPYPNLRTTYSTHNWINGDHEDRRWFPHQNWFYYTFGGYFNADNWVDYACEWDPNFIRIYVNNNIIYCFPRYFRNGSYTTDCAAQPGVPYQLNPKFPTVPAISPIQERSNLRFTLDLDDDNLFDGGKAEWGVQSFGEVDIDYVRIYQREPDKNHHDLCDRMISGPNSLCNNLPVTYTVVGTGAADMIYNAWATSSNLTITSQTNNTITVSANSGTNSTSSWIKYQDDNPVCPIVQKNIPISNPPAPHVIKIIAGFQNQGGGTTYLHILWLTNPQIGSTYWWLIDDANVYSSFYGPLVLKQSLSSVITYNLSTYNDCGISQTNGFGKLTDANVDSLSISIADSCINLSDTTSFLNGIAKLFYLTGSISNSTIIVPNSDSSQYDTITLSAPNYADTAILYTSVSQIDTNALKDSIYALIANYCSTDTSNTTNITDTTIANVTDTTNDCSSVIYPNPVTDVMNIQLCNGYDVNSTIELDLYDMSGNVIKTFNLSYSSVLTINVGDLMPGNYGLLITQGSDWDFEEFVKQ